MRIKHQLKPGHKLFLMCQVPIREEHLIVPVEARNVDGAFTQVQEILGKELKPTVLSGDVEGFTDGERNFVWGWNLTKFQEMN